MRYLATFELRIFAPEDLDDHTVEYGSNIFDEAREAALDIIRKKMPRGLTVTTNDKYGLSCDVKV